MFAGMTFHKIVSAWPVNTAFDAIPRHTPMPRDPVEDLIALLPYLHHLLAGESARIGQLSSPAREERGPVKDKPISANLGDHCMEITAIGIRQVESDGHVVTLLLTDDNSLTVGSSG